MTAVSTGNSRTHSRHLPTPRMSPYNQIKLLCAIEELSAGGRPVRVQDAADHVPISRTHASLVPRFAMDCGLLSRAGKGIYMPTAALQRFATLWGDEDSSQKAAREALAEVFQRLWFAEEARKLLSNGPRRVDELIAQLLKASGGPGHSERKRTALLYLVEWMEIALMVTQSRDGFVSLAPTLPSPQVERKETPPPLSEKRSLPEQRNGVYAVSVDVRLTAEDLARFEPQEFSDVMAALCTVMKAQSYYAQNAQ